MLTLLLVSIFEKKKQGEGMISKIHNIFLILLANVKLYIRLYLDKNATLDYINLIY